MVYTPKFVKTSKSPNLTNLFENPNFSLKE